LIYCSPFINIRIGQCDVGMTNMTSIDEQVGYLINSAIRIKKFGSHFSSIANKFTP